MYYANTGHTHNDLDEINLFEFSNRIGALITYIMIQALSPKKILSYNENLLGIDVRIKGKDKYNMSSNWVSKAIIPTLILSEFCKLWMMERGLAVLINYLLINIYRLKSRIIFLQPKRSSANMRAIFVTLRNG